MPKSCFNCLFRWTNSCWKWHFWGSENLRTVARKRLKSGKRLITWEMNNIFSYVSFTTHTWNSSNVFIVFFIQNFKFLERCFVLFITQNCVFFSVFFRFFWIRQNLLIKWKIQCWMMVIAENDNKRKDSLKMYWNGN